MSLDEHAIGYRSEEKPSPFRASTYPDPNSAAGSHRPVLPPPQGTSQPPPPQPSQHEKQLEHRISLLMKHNRDLETQLERQLHVNNSRELERYKNRVHDLEVEVRNYKRTTLPTSYSFFGSRSSLFLHSIYLFCALLFIIE